MFNKKFLKIFKKLLLRFIYKVNLVRFTALSVNSCLIFILFPFFQLKWYEIKMFFINKFFLFMTILFTCKNVWSFKLEDVLSTWGWFYKSNEVPGTEHHINELIKYNGQL